MKEPEAMPPAPFIIPENKYKRRTFRFFKHFIRDSFVITYIHLTLQYNFNIRSMQYDT